MADDQQPAPDDQLPEDDKDAGGLSEEQVDALLSGGPGEEPDTEGPEVLGALSEPAAEDEPVAEDEPAAAKAEPDTEPLLDDTVLDRLLADTQGVSDIDRATREPAGSSDDDDLFGEKRKTRFEGAGQESAAPAPIREGRSENVRELDLLAEVVLTVSAEIGRAEMTIEDVLKLGPGSLIELDKLAGEPVELLVNDRCIARGEVVVVDDSFGVRITELGE